MHHVTLFLREEAPSYTLQKEIDVRLNGAFAGMDLGALQLLLQLTRLLCVNPTIPCLLIDTTIRLFHMSFEIENGAGRHCQR